MVYRVKRPAESQQFEEEKKEGHSGPQLYYDPEWIGILQATQELIPLSDARHDFTFLTRFDEELVASIFERADKLNQSDLAIPFSEEQVYET